MTSGVKVISPKIGDPLIRYKSTLTKGKGSDKREAIDIISSNAPGRGIISLISDSENLQIQDRHSNPCHKP